MISLFGLFALFGGLLSGLPAVVLAVLVYPLPGLPQVLPMLLAELAMY
jgi:hypothetical protein